jgi:hypothetical protein
MAPNVVAGGQIIKHVFEACRGIRVVSLAAAKFVGGPFYRLATVRSHVLLIEHLID